MYGVIMDPKDQSPIDEASYIRWLQTIERADTIDDQIEILPPVRVRMLIAKYANAGLFTQERLIDFLKDDHTRLALVLNPTLSEDQIRLMFDWALNDYLQTGLMEPYDTLVALQATERINDYGVWRKKLRDLLNTPASADARENEKKRRAASTMFFFWQELTLEDLEAAFRWVSEYQLQNIVFHPAVSLELLNKVWQRAKSFDSTHVLKAVARHPLIAEDPGLKSEIASHYDPGIAAAAMEHFPISRTEELLKRYAEKAQREVLVFLRSLSSRVRRQLQPSALLPLLSSADKNIRLEAQRFLAQVNRTSSEAETPPVAMVARDRSRASQGLRSQEQARRSRKL